MRKLSVLLSILVLVGVAGAASGGDMLEPGMPFPAWKLQDHTGATLSSKDLAGKTYLLWYYPKAMTPGCTKEGCTLRDNFDAFKKSGIEILGISFDEPKENAEFVAKEKFPFRLLSDTDKSLAVQVGAADSKARMWARRISYLVGPEGTVLKAYDDVTPGNHAAEVLADFAATK